MKKGEKYVTRFAIIEKAYPVCEADLKVIEVTCQVFGCGRTLTRQEKLCGNKCIKHQEIKKVTWFGNY